MAKTKIKHRHSVDGGYARGVETRTRIIATALRVFGEEGFNKASTRQIAADAGVNPPALQYYFGGKEGLHRACAQSIIDQVMAIVGPVLIDARQVAVSAQRERVVEAVCAVLDAMADGLVATGSESWSRFITRGKADGAGPAIVMLRQSISKPIMQTLAQLIALASDADPADEIIRIKAIAIFGQLSTFLTSREHTMEMLNWPDFNAVRLQLIKSVVRAHTSAILAADAGAGNKQSRPRAGKSSTIANPANKSSTAKTTRKKITRKI